ncbi:hypothetical protein SKAU_G00044660 [Synaphobranchus kaupii]|uniref:Uncharacterized protein n=1 Tax=Synaphobranchus kaupii TaxID=118154 RepID=A0A9Q1G281_SYNKA|nr:hypothetical protein SKAU_G00044660 [Synaphobranchus kaupii]
MVCSCSRGRSPHQTPAPTTNRLPVILIPFHSHLSNVLTYIQPAPSSLFNAPCSLCQLWTDEQKGRSNLSTLAPGSVRLSDTGEMLELKA